MNSHQDITGRLIGTLKVLSIFRRVPELCWHCICAREGCNTHQVVRHTLLVNNAAKCQNSACGRAVSKETRATAASAGNGIRSSDRAESETWQRSQPRQPQPSTPDPDAERRKAARDEAHKRALNAVREQHRRYAEHQLERGVPTEQLMSLERFAEIGEFAQKRIAEIIERDEKVAAS